MAQPNQGSRWCTRAFWQELMQQLCLRGKQRHESGAFLLGHSRSAQVVHAVYYETLDPNVYARGIVEFNGSRFSELWTQCRTLQLSVLADVHTHPGSARQSESDRGHPMIGRCGHVAVIIPSYAREPWTLTRVGVYEYTGGKCWATRSAPKLNGDRLEF